MKVILHYPTQKRTETVYDVESFETEIGPENTVRLEGPNGETETRTAPDLRVAAVGL